MSVRRPRFPCVRLLFACLVLLAGALAVASPGFAREPAPPTLRTLTATGDGRAMYPPFDPDVHHYAVGCDESERLTLTLSAANAATRVTIDGTAYPSPDAVVELTGVSPDGDIVVSLSGAGGSATYTIHCLPPGFPTITARKANGGAPDVLVLASVRTDNDRYHMILDDNGVPRFQRWEPATSRYLRYHPDGLYPFSLFRRAGSIPTFRGVDLPTYEAAVLDWDLREVDAGIRVAPPLTHTDSHSFAIKPNGNYVLLSYEPAQRDFSALLDPNGNPYGATEGTEDSVISEVTPGGEMVFQWNAWDHLAVTVDCLQHYFPRDHAHVNSLQIVEGDIIASFRGCSQVLRIDGTTGDVIWMLGRSNQSDADWIASGAPAPLKIVGDPYGEFCGQHAARLRPNGNLVLYDNGAHCLIDPETRASARVDGAFSRVVEYSLDLESGQAVFQRHYSLHGTFDRFTLSSGHVEVLDNGDWLIGWGRNRDDPAPALSPDESITLVDPLTGRERLSIAITDGDDLLSTRAWPLPPDALEWRPARSLSGIERGWNRIIWRGRDGVSIEGALRAAGRAIGAIHAREAESRSWLSFFPDSPAPLATNTLDALTAGQRYWIAAR